MITGPRTHTNLRGDVTVLPVTLREEMETAYLAAWARSVQFAPLGNPRVKALREHAIGRAEETRSDRPLRQAIEIFEAFSKATDNQLRAASFANTIIIPKPAVGPVVTMVHVQNAAAINESVKAGVAALAARGIFLRVERGKIVAANAGLLTPADREFLRQRKPALMPIILRNADEVIA